MGGGGGHCLVDWWHAIVFLKGPTQWLYKTLGLGLKQDIMLKTLDLISSLLHGTR